MFEPTATAFEVIDGPCTLTIVLLHFLKDPLYRNRANPLDPLKDPCRSLKESHIIVFGRVSARVCCGRFGFMAARSVPIPVNAVLFLSAYSSLLL